MLGFCEGGPRVGRSRIVVGHAPGDSPEQPLLIFSGALLMCRAQRAHWPLSRRLSGRIRRTCWISCHGSPRLTEHVAFAVRATPSRQVAPLANGYHRSAPRSKTERRGAAGRADSVPDRVTDRIEGAVPEQVGSGGAQRGRHSGGREHHLGGAAELAAAKAHRVMRLGSRFRPKTCRTLGRKRLAPPRPHPASQEPRSKDSSRGAR